MAEKRLQGRLVNKHDTEANWEKAINFIPMKGEIIIYDRDNTYNYERIKIGDGVTVVSSLPFVDDANKITIDSAISESSTNPVQNKVVKDYVDSEREKWIGNKIVSAQIAEGVANKVDKVSGMGLSTNDYTATEKNKLANIAAGAEVNQNAFSNVVVGNTTIAADSKTDSLTLVGSNVTLTPDATDDKLTIGITKSDVTTALGYTPPATDTTYEAAGSTLGLVKSGGDVTISDGVITVNDDSHNHLISNIDGLADILGDGTVAEQIAAAGYAKSSFSKIVVGSTNIEADSAADTLTLVAGSNITLTPDAANDELTITATDTVYTHPAYEGKTGAPTSNVTPTFGGTFKVSQPVSDTMGHITALNARTITIPSNTATTSTAGLMSSADKTKLDGIATGATKITVDSALSSSSTNPVQNKIVNAAISNLNTLVGDESVSKQIASAVAVKADDNHTHTASQVGAVPTSGGAFSGSVSVPSLNVKGDWGQIYFYNTDGTHQRGGIIYDGTACRLAVKGTDSNYVEYFQTPAPDAGRTSTGWFNLLTTKNTVTVGQGGTGATSGVAALKNLGLEIQCGYVTEVSTGTNGQQVTFATAFSQIPAVVLTGTTENTAGVYVQNVSKTGFTIKGATASKKVYWVAVVSSASGNGGVAAI